MRMAAGYKIEKSGDISDSIVNRIKELICVFSSVIALATFLIVCFPAMICNATSNDSINYPEIIPQNLSCRYGYEYLGTQQHGDLYQKLYNLLDEWMWETYNSDEEFEVYSEYEGLINNYIAVKQNLKDYFSDDEIELLNQQNETCIDLDLFNYWFTMDNPIYYFTWDVSGPHGAFEEFEDGVWTGNIIVPARTYICDDDINNVYYLGDYGDLETRRHIRNQVVRKLHEYYDLASQYSSELDKEIAIREKLIREVTYYNYADDGNYQIPNHHTFVGAFDGGFAVCEGFSTAFAIACNYCGLDCMFITGDLTGSPHAWNSIKLGDEWYGVDVTLVNHDVGYNAEWKSIESGYYNTTGYVSADISSFAYLNVPDSLFSASHEIEYEHQSEYPVFSNDFRYYLVGIINEYDGDCDFDEKLTGDQIQAAGEYLKKQLRAGLYCIDIGAYDTWDLSSDAFYSEIRQSISEYSVESGKDFRLSYYYDFSATGMLSVPLIVCRVLVSEYQEDSDRNIWWLHNVDGSGNGVGVNYICNHSGNKNFYIPENRNDEIVKSVIIGWDFFADHIVVPDSVRYFEMNPGRNGNCQIVIREGLKQLFIANYRNSYFDENMDLVLCDPYMSGVFVPRSVDALRIDGDLDIYGYSGSTAEQYALDEGFTFYDVTGKTLIDNIRLSNVILPKTGDSGFEMDVSDLRANDSVVIESIEYEKPNGIYESGNEYSVTIKLHAKDGYALTPNTLVDVNGKMAYIECNGTRNATIVYRYMLNDLIDFSQFIAPEGCVFQFRLYNPNSGEHFYTGSQEEALNLVSLGWNFEGSGFITPTVGPAIYRLYSAEHGDHFYTTDEAERDALVAEGWTLDGGTGIAFPSATEETGRPMYRLHNPNAYPNGEAGAHHFTMSWEEVENLVAVGWQYEFVAWYSV